MIEWWKPAKAELGLDRDIMIRTDGARRHEAGSRFFASESTAFS
jgi:hypothetical protein